MPAANYNFTLEQGIPLSKTIFLKNPNDTIKDLTGFTAKMQIRQYPGHETVILELSSANTKININTTTGAVSMIFSSEDTESLNYDELSYDLILYNGSSTFRALEGKLTIKETTTK